MLKKFRYGGGIVCQAIGEAPCSDRSRLAIALRLPLWGSRSHPTPPGALSGWFRGRVGLTDPQGDKCCTRTLDLRASKGSLMNYRNLDALFIHAHSTETE